MPKPAPRLVLVPGLGLDARSSARVRAAVPADVVLLPGMAEGPPPPHPSHARGGPLEGAGRWAGAAGRPLAELPVETPRPPHRSQARGEPLDGATTDPRLRSAAGLVRRWLATAVREPWWQAPLVLTQWLSTGPRAMRWLWRSASPDRIDVRLRAVAVPVTVVRGTRDRLCPHDWAVAVAAAAPHGRLVELPGAAHMTVQTHPGEVAEVLRQAADGVGRRRRRGA